MIRLIRSITVAVAALVLVAATATARPVADRHQAADPQGVRPQTAHGFVRTQPPDDDGGISPIVYILPTAGLLTMLGAATVYVKTSGRRHARA
jgi:hypothetical protein